MNHADRIRNIKLPATMAPRTPVCSLHEGDLPDALVTAENFVTFSPNELPEPLAAAPMTEP